MINSNKMTKKRMKMTTMENQETSKKLQEENKLKVQAEDFVSDVDDANVGTLLKKEREKKKKDLRKVSEILCIRECYLQALEQSDYEKFPGRTYAIGFLRTYADFLGLDVNALVEKYHKESNFLKEDVLDMPILDKPNLFPKAKYFFIAVLVIVLMWSFWYFLTYPSTADIDLPVEQEQISVPVVEEVEVVKAVEETPVVVIEENVKKEEKKQALPDKKNQKEPAAKKGVQIIANDEVWVEIEEDDVLILSRTLKKGEVYNVPTSETELFLKTGNAGAMDILVDGQKIKPLGPVGAVRSGISLSADKLKKH